MEQREGQFRGAGGLDLFYQCWQPGAPPRAILVIIHGFGEHGGRYMNVVNHLVPKGYAVYALDHRGHGRSPGKRGHINGWNEFREDVQAFLGMIQESEAGCPLFLMGHSLGGLLVLEYTLHHPEGLAGVVASGPALAQTGVSPALIFLSRILSRLLPSFGIDTGLDAAGVSRDPAVVKAYRDDPLVHSMATARLGTEMAAAQEWTLSHAAGWKLPLLILHGTADQLVPIGPSRAFFEQVPIADKRMVEYEGGYHEPHNDTIHEQVTADLDKWLEEHQA